MFFLGSVAGAEPAPYVVISPEVEVRSGPSLEYYLTSKLRRGDTVRVIREEAKGWLAIEPPAGSFSWINAKDVERTTSGVAVSMDGAPLRVGSRLRNEPPTVERVRLKVGTQLFVIGRGEVSSDGTWLPVTPAPSEVRYIPAETVQISKAPPLIATSASPVPPAPSVSATIATPLLVQAESAERAGRLAEAQSLYAQLAQQTMATDHELAVHYLNYSHTLGERQRMARGDAFQPSSTAARPIPAGSPAVFAAAQSPRAPAYSQYCYVQDCCYPVKLIPPAVSAPQPTSQLPMPVAAPTNQANWYGPGRLYRTAFTLDGKQAYGLEPAKGGVRLYLTAAADLPLDSLVEKTVYVYGPARYHGELRTYYVTASQVTPLR
jgi:hypothetical protein